MICKRRESRILANSPVPYLFRWFSRRFCLNQQKTCCTSLSDAVSTPNHRRISGGGHPRRRDRRKRTLYVNVFRSPSSSLLLPALPASFSRSNLRSHLFSRRSSRSLPCRKWFAAFFFLHRYFTPFAWCHGRFFEDYSFGILKWYVFRKIVRITLLIPLILLLFRSESFAMS